MQKRFYITGVSGVGKSTISEILNQKGIYSIDIDKVKGLCHWRNKATKEKAYWYSGIENEWHEAHEWICDKERLLELINKSKDVVVVVGCASNQDEFVNLFDSIFLLFCKPEIFIERINNRTGNDFGKHDIEKKRILNWYKDYEDRLLKQGAIAINTEEPIDIIVEKIIKNIISLTKKDYE